MELAFPEFLVFFFPAVHAAIDWRRRIRFLNQELRKVSRDSATGARQVDALVEVARKGSRYRERIYIHIEVQATREADFARRMFTYNYRLFDRFAKPVASLAVLADDRRGWRPDGWGFEAFGTRHRLDFPVVKLLDRESDIEERLEDPDPNPFVLVTAAHLLTRKTRGRPEQRLAAKWKLIRLMYERRWDKARVIGFFKVLDWMMVLPSALEARLWQDIGSLERDRGMAFISSVEKIGMRKGFEKGLQKGERSGAANMLIRQLTTRFGPLPEAVVARLRSGTEAEHARWAERLLTAPSLDAVFSNEPSATH